MKKRIPNFKKAILFVGLVSVVSPNLAGSLLGAKTSERMGIEQNVATVRGTVIDSYGDPLIGVSVVVEGTTIGTLTDIDGKYSITPTNSDATLVFSYLGFVTQKIKLGGKTTIEITLQEDSRLLDEVVVTALGIKKEKKALGYAMSSVSGDDLTTSGSPMNAMSSLYGKAAGLQIGSTSGGATGGMNIKIRNAVSLTESSNTRPLIVVDGIPIKDGNTSSSDRSIESGGDRGTGINDINADDIASIQVLKGAKAAVLYGSEGANGVLLITTKSGTRPGGKGLGIDFSSNYAWIKAAYTPEYQNEFGTGVSASKASPENISAEGFYQRKNGVGEYVDSYWPEQSASFGPRMDGRQLYSWDDEMRSYRAYKNNLTDLYRTGGQANINLALSNSGDMGSFRVGYNYKDYKGIVQEATNYSHSFSFNGDLKANDFIRIKASTSFTQNRDRNSPFRHQDLSSYGIPRDLDTKMMNNMYRSELGYSYFSEPTMARNFPAGKYIGEYLFAQNEDVNDYKRNHLIQSLSMDVKLNKNISWTSLGGIDYTIIENEMMENFKRPKTEKALQGYYGLKTEHFATYYAQSTLNFDYDLTDKLNFSALAGGAIKRNVDDMQKTYIKEQFSLENYFSFTNTTNPEGARAERKRGKDLLLSLFASAQLAYDNQVYLELQGRNDWSSILPKENNNYFYPGASLSWVASQTFRNELPEVISFAKLRASWADVGRPGPRYYGNVSFKLNSYGGQPTLEMPTYLPPADFASDGKGFPKPSLKPERKREFELGFETTFFDKHPVSVDFSWYTSNTYNQIVTLPVPTSSGVKDVRLNAGDIGQTGLELSINTRPVVTKDLVWNIGVNFSRYTTKIKELDKGITRQALWGGTGVDVVAPLNGEFGEIWVRPYEVYEGEGAANGQRKVGNNGTWITDNTKWKKVGKITPDIIGGLNTSLSYKDFTLSANFDFQFGGTLISQTNMYMLGNGTGKNSLQYRDEANGGMPYYVQKSGDTEKLVALDSHSASVPKDSKYPFILHDGVIVDGVKADGTPNDKVIPASDYYSTTFWQSGNALSEDMIYKSDYISLRQLSIGYALPKKLISKAKIQSARITVFANNLAYLYKDVPNTTPESTMGTNDFTEFNITPMTRTFGIGLNLSF